MNKANELPMETLKAAPSVTVGTLYLFGYPLSDWLLLVTIVYYLTLTVFLVRDKWWRQRGKGKGGDRTSEKPPENDSELDKV